MRSCRLLLLALGLSAAPAFADDAKKPDAPPAPKQDVIKFEGKTASELLLSVKKQGGRLASKEDFEAAAKALDLGLKQV